jgi:urease accessory protein
MPAKRSFTAFLAVSVALAAAAAQAHTLETPGVGQGFPAGFFHPFLGLDHALAMASIGLLAAQQGGRLFWRLPLAFLGMMAVGAAAGVAALPLPMVEAGIATSVLVLGLLLASGARLPVGASLVLAGLFALLHGYAHGAEAPPSASLAYGLGFLAATAALHLMGMALGIGMRRVHSPLLLRAGGVAIAAAGLLSWA